MAAAMFLCKDHQNTVLTLSQMRHFPRRVTPLSHGTQMGVMRFDLCVLCEEWRRALREGGKVRSRGACRIALRRPRRFCSKEQSNQ